MADFSLESILQVLFLRQPAPFDALGAWAKVFGSSPDGFQKMPAGAASQANGVVDGKAITILVGEGATRIDLNVQQAGDGPPPLRRIEDTPATIQMGSTLLAKLMDDLSVGRTATVLTGNKLVGSSSEAVAELASFLPGIPAPAGTEEATYRIVVPRAASYNPNRKLKQIGLWQTARVQYMQFSIGNAGANAAEPVFSSFAVNAVIDIYGDGLIEMSSATALAELREIGSIAERAFKGGLDEFV